MCWKSGDWVSVTLSRDSLNVYASVLIFVPPLEVIIPFKLFLLKGGSVVYKYICPSGKLWGFASIEIKENQSFCTTKHTSVNSINADAASINSHTNTFFLSALCFSRGSTGARSRQNSICSLIPYQKHGQSSVCQA